MRILVMGGTWFLGRAVAQEALARGWQVSTFNRGRSGVDLPGVEAFRGDRTVAQDLAGLAAAGPWDAVVDTSSSALAPCSVLAGARALEPVARRYIYVSTVNAYRGWPDDPLTEESELLDGPPDADADYGRQPKSWDGPDLHYGRQKAGAERAVWEAFGADRVAVLRPGVILGPGEYVGRLPWWLRRAERGGAILAPGQPAKGIQPVDVRDAAIFALDQATVSGGGAYNVTAPIGRETMGGFLDKCLEVTGRRGHLVWAADDLLIEHGVRQWTELPLWRTHRGVWNIGSDRAQAAGLVCRRLAETVEATWAWLHQGGIPVQHPRWSEHGIAREKEAAVLAAAGGSGVSAVEGEVC
ncbi:NAD-dependent epimerase/dehydratase family protein [Streptomyces luteireticuli]